VLSSLGARFEILVDKKNKEEITETKNKFNNIETHFLLTFSLHFL